MSTAIAHRGIKLPVAYVLFVGCFFCLSGLHRFYCGRWKSGLLWFFTGGLCGIGNVIDFFVMPNLVHGANHGARGF